VTLNLIVFAASVLLVGIGVTAAIGWAWAFIVVGGIVGLVTLVATLKGK
jgi:hypothetical protein